MNCVCIFSPMCLCWPYKTTTIKTENVSNSHLINCFVCSAIVFILPFVYCVYTTYDKHSRTHSPAQRTKTDCDCADRAYYSAQIHTANYGMNRFQRKKDISSFQKKYLINKIAISRIKKNWTCTFYWMDPHWKNTVRLVCWHIFLLRRNYSMASMSSHFFPSFYCQYNAQHKYVWSVGYSFVVLNPQHK